MRREGIPVKKVKKEKVLCIRATDICQRIRRRNHKYISENQEKESQILIRESGEGITNTYHRIRRRYHKNISEIHQK